MNNDQNTDPVTDPGQTGGGDPSTTPPAVTPQTKDDGAANGGEKTITLSEKDYKNLVAQRDRNAEEARQSSDFVETLAKEREIDGFLAANKDKFPDVTRDDLMHLEDPTLLESEAQRMQTRFQTVVQDKLKQMEITTPPALSAADKAAREKALKKDPQKDSFEKMAELRMSPTAK